MIADAIDLRCLFIGASLYDPKTLVVIRLSTLKEFEKYQK